MIRPEASANVHVTPIPMPRIRPCTVAYSQCHLDPDAGRGTVNAAALTRPNGMRISHNPLTQLPDVYFPQW